MIRRAAPLIYGYASYLVFLLSFAYAPAFIGDVLVPRTIDVGPQSGLSTAVPINVLLLGAFGLQHSVMARRSFKRWWTRIVPASCERSTYVLMSSLLLVLMYWQWRPIAPTIWQVDGWPATALVGLFWMGWLIALVSTYQIDHFELFGLRQVGGLFRAAADRLQTLKTPLLYRLVRHPMMLGLLVAFWATPHMTLGHLLFAVMMTAYVLVGLRFEERDLVTDFGASYEDYQRRVPMLVPNPFGSPAAEPEPRRGR